MKHKNNFNKIKILVTTAFLVLYSHFSKAYLKPLFCKECLAEKNLYSSQDRIKFDNKQGLDGIKFNCTTKEIKKIKDPFLGYLRHLKINPNWVQLTELPKMPTVPKMPNEPQELMRNKSQNTSVLFISLKTLSTDDNTLDLHQRKIYNIQSEKIKLPSKDQRFRIVHTVSKKEILLALMQHGRITEFSDKNCHIQALKEHIEVRQNIVAWTEDLNWIWPNGDYAYWNPQFWDSGTPLKKELVVTAFADKFINQDKYSFGCYAAARSVYVQGILDYYSRVKKNPKKLNQVIEALYSRNQDPLVGVEPGNMWDWEGDFEVTEKDRPGKLLDLVNHVSGKNFIPGDWSYFLNTDPVTYQKTGYEGSNAVYLGSGRFDDFYNDHNHFYLFHEKLDEVFQWRNQVFSRSRDADKIQKLSLQDYENLTLTPDKGGVILNFRAVPKFNF